VGFTFGDWTNLDDGTIEYHRLQAWSGRVVLADLPWWPGKLAFGISIRERRPWRC